MTCHIQTLRYSILWFYFHYLQSLQILQIFWEFPTKCISNMTWLRYYTCFTWHSIKNSVFGASNVSQDISQSTTGAIQNESESVVNFNKEATTFRLPQWLQLAKSKLAIVSCNCQHSQSRVSSPAFDASQSFANKISRMKI